MTFLLHAHFSFFLSSMLTLCPRGSPGEVPSSLSSSARLRSLFRTPGYFTQLGALHLDSEPCFVQNRGETGSQRQLGRYSRIGGAAQTTHFISKCNADACLKRRGTTVCLLALLRCQRGRRWRRQRSVDLPTQM